MSDVQKFLRPILNSTEFSTFPLAGDASSRRYYRVVSGDKSWVLMEWDPFKNPSQFPFLSVQKYFFDHNIPVPNVLGFCEAQGLFLLEDLGDLTLERKFWEFQNQENILPYYQTTLSELIKIHSLSFQQIPRTCTAYDVEFSVEKLMWEFHYMMEHLIDRKFGLVLSNEMRTQLENEFLDICTHLAELPQVICHRDFHSRNVMIKHGKIHIIDFQDARMGPAVYDLVSLLLDSYVSLNPKTIDTLLAEYISEFPFWKNICASKASFLQDFDLQAIQRCLKACGSFASFFNTRNDDRYLKHIPLTANLVCEKLKGFPKYKALPELLEMARPHWQNL